MGFNAYGSDIDQRMVDFSLQNLAWLRSRTAGLASQSRLETGDARSHSWQTPISAVATESYLGRPLKTPPANLADMIITIDNLHKKFLINIQKQLLPGTRLCLALPAWYVNDAYQHLPTLDRLDNLGYNRVAFEHAKAQDLIYRRPDQIVARQLVILVRK
jgi:tRNA G10  N-methylase Trm11